MAKILLENNVFQTFLSAIGQYYFQTQDEGYVFGRFSETRINCEAETCEKKGC